jgi:hypothetical protein
MSTRQRGVVFLPILIVVLILGVVAFWVLQSKNSIKKPGTEAPTLQSDTAPDDRCYWDFREITPVGNPQKWTGWYNDANVVPNKCKPITLSTGADPQIPFDSEQECKDACVSEVYQSLETLENKYPLNHVGGVGRYYQATNKFTFEDPLYKLTVAVPANYYLQVGNGREMFTQISNQTKSIDELPEGTGWFNLSIGTFVKEYLPDVPQDTLDGFVNAYLDSPNLTIVNSTDTEIDGIDAKKVIIRPYDWDFPLTTSYFIKRDKIYQISCKYNQDNQLNLCEEIVKTVKFTSSQNN